MKKFSPDYVLIYGKKAWAPHKIQFCNAKCCVLKLNLLNLIFIIMKSVRERKFEDGFCRGEAHSVNFFPTLFIVTFFSALIKGKKIFFWEILLSMPQFLSYVKIYF